MGRKRKDNRDKDSILIRLKTPVAERLRKHGKMQETYTELTTRLLNDVEAKNEQNKPISQE